jgi:DNA (cytosine-5)-methyltransferase 1
MSKRKLNFIDLFAGAGGLSEGFVKAGFFPIAHIEMNHDAVETLKTREVYHYLNNTNCLDRYNSYLLGRISKDEIRRSVPPEILDRVIEEKMTIEGLPALFSKIDSLMKTFKTQKIDVVVGGPPCQAYSLIGRPNNKEKKNDERLYLYKIYSCFLERYQPKMFVFENVPGILSCTSDGHTHFEDIQKCLKNVGYEVDHKILCASDYGVLQNRRRVILIGWKKDSEWHYPTIETKHYCGTINDLLNDLQPVEPGESNNNYRSGNFSSYLRRSLIRTRGDVLTWHLARPTRELDREIYREAIDLWNNSHRRLNYNDLPDELKTHQNRRSFTDRFKVVSGDLPFCQTVMAHISKDGHYFIHPDYRQARSLTVREAARIQSFPDNFFFEGSRTSAFVQVGNAVPPLLAEAIANGIKKLLVSKLRETV